MIKKINRLKIIVNKNKNKKYNIKMPSRDGKP